MPTQGVRPSRPDVVARFWCVEVEGDLETTLASKGTT
jgi:hypothetical protein